LPSLPPDFIRDETGAQTLLGYVVDLTRRDGTALCHLDIEDKHGNRHGGLHGGIIACMLDNAMGYAAALSFDDSGKTRVHTLSMTTNFVAPASTGRVTAHGVVTGGGRATVFAEGHVQDDEGRVIASATGVYKRVKDQ